MTNPEPTSTAPDADRAEGPSLADVDELCAAITRWRTRWRAPVADPVAAQDTEVDWESMTARMDFGMAKPSKPVAPPAIEISDEAVTGVSALMLRLARSANPSALPAQGADQKPQSFSARRSPHPDCDMPLYAHPQASAAPAADQAEGPSVADVAELCDEFGFLFDYTRDEGIEMLQQVITAALARWRAPVVEPVATPATQEPDGDRVQRLAAIIREADLRLDANTLVLGENELAQALLAHPGFSGCHDGANVLPAQGEVAELVEFLSGVADWQQHQCHADKVRRAAELLKALNMGGWIVPTVEQATPPASEVQGVAVDWY